MYFSILVYFLIRKIVSGVNAYSDDINLNFIFKDGFVATGWRPTNVDGHRFMEVHMFYSFEKSNEKKQ